MSQEQTEKPDKYGQQYRQGDLLFIHVKDVPRLQLSKKYEKQFGPRPEDKGVPNIPHPLLTPKTDTVVIEGEVTGHQHKLRSGQILLLVSDIKEANAIEARTRAKFASWNTQDTGAALRRGAMGYAILEQATVLEHPEHKPIELPAGVYEIRRQQVFQDEVFGESERPRFVED